MTRRTRIQQNNNNIFQVEMLLNNYVDEDIQSMLLPLNMLHFIRLCPKFIIRDNFITPNSSKFNSVFFIATIVWLFALFYDIHTEFWEELVNFNITDSVSFSVFFSSGLIVNLSLSVFRTRDYVSFVLKFQNVHRFLNNESDFKVFTFINWFIVILFVIIYGGFVIILILITDTLTIQLFCAFVLLSFDADIIYIIRFMKLLKDKFNLWNEQALQVRNMRDGNKEEYCQKLYQAYIDIMECYRLIKTFSRLVVSKKQASLPVSLESFLVNYFIAKTSCYCSISSTSRNYYPQ
ncbi:hypothetical protein B5X24_HaOG200728 [Helicoverpa armigera]|uniref:Gustatory receptor n=1 Tax=Helicoverpa armigera TaxID=29058 RepID=A0A2W1BQ20_HELAM|nr:hypothetical protein B5X24_HaOG200728 [Helicoverpa armigera]